MKLLHVSILLLLTSCASLRYPNWEKVSLETCVHNKPCIKKGVSEPCTSGSNCTDWFKKRATLVNANTVVTSSPSSKTAEFFQCENNLPLYKASNELSDVIFNKEDHKKYFISEGYSVKGVSNRSDIKKSISHGNLDYLQAIGTIDDSIDLRYNGHISSISGQAFSGKRGELASCVGETVLMYPDTQYFNNVDNLNKLTYLPDEGCKIPVDPDNNASKLIRKTQCNIEGDYEFINVPPGNYNITMKVKWYSFASGVSTGVFRKKIIVKENGVVMFVIQENGINKYIVED